MSKDLRRTRVVTENHYIEFNSEEYSYYQLPDGRYVIVPIEWMDSVYIHVTSSGTKVTDFGLEWEEK